MNNESLQVIGTESLSDYFVRLGELYKSGKLDDIHSSKNLESFVTENRDYFKVKFLPVDFTNINRFYFKEIRKGFESPSHSHDSPTFRYIIKGSLILNDVRYSEGDWVLVPKNIKYSIKTDEDVLMQYACNHG
ncbi:cupin domain-containing protein [Pleurocapsales cyanobacterium LEGE 10410]|nr:cupin domain-containing protein [Pleurocapsales cyanobacterium LEGE 10410]